MSYQNRCPECEGRGYHEYPRAVARSEGKDYYIVEIECEECSGRGLIINDIFSNNSIEDNLLESDAVVE